MGFQDNSGDIIFDVVLTDEGRRALSDPTVDFKITKFRFIKIFHFIFLIFVLCQLQYIQ